MHANVAALQQRAEHAEAESAALREQLRAAEPLRVAAAQLQSEVHELQTVVSMHKTSAKHAEQEHVQAQETIQELYVESCSCSTAKAYVVEHALRERDEEIEALRDARRRHTEQIRTLRASEKALRAERDAHGWHERIAQLERELIAKAEEVEAADTRILDTLRENKRLAAQNKALHARLAAAPERAAPLHDRTNQREAPAPSPRASPTKPARGDARASPTKPARGDARFLDRLARFKPVS